MKKQDVQISGVYFAKVSAVITTVKILRESSYGGWDAVNVETKRQVHIKTAGRLRGRADLTRVERVKQILHDRRGDWFSPDRNKEV